MPGRTKPARTTDWSSEIPKIFDQAQVTSANHQKNYVALYKLHCEASANAESEQHVRSTAERVFEDSFLQMVARILPVKKGATQVDRVVKFVGGYVKLINEKAAEERTKNVREAGDDDDTTASRFTARLLRFLIKGFPAKDKTVRFRVLQLVAELVSHLGEIDEDLYMLLRSSLLDRVHDKEPPIRAQAVISLSKLSASEDPADVAEGEPTIIDVLTETLTYDPAVDVRRATLLNIPLIPATLDVVLSRSRDTDTTVRKAVYTVLDPTTQHAGTVGITHPRALTVSQRELIVRNGLGDREPTVKTAAENLVGIWAKIICEKDGTKEEERAENAEVDTAVEDMVAFLKMFDLGEDAVAESALLTVFTTQIALFEKLKFGETFWSALTPETAFLARVFVDHCVATKDDVRLESAVPVVTALAFKIQSAYNELLEDIQAAEEERLLRGIGADEGREDERIDKEFVIGEMLKLAVNLDYADEIGRRKMFQLVRDMISQDTLPENLVARCPDVLRTLSANERDLIRLIVEVVHDLRDSSDPEDDAPRPDEAEANFGETPTTARVARVQKPVEDVTPEEKEKADAIDLRCLSLCIGMLERVNGTFEENSTLEGILGELILPAVKSKDLALREKGLVSLGLCCLIARRMALNSFQLFLAQIQSSPEVLKIRVLQIVFDILMVHEGEFLGKGGEHAENILKFLLNVLSNEKSDKAQALLCTGLAKLMLAGIISDEQALKDLVMAYLSPDSVNNHELRQALSYFFPVYCYSSPVNQRRMQEIFIPTFEKVSEMRKEQEDEDEIVSMAQVGGMFLDWTDPQKAIDVQGLKPDDMIHFDMAGDIVKALFKKEFEKEDRKVLCQLLGKLHVPDAVDDDKLRSLKVLMHSLHSRRPLRDTTASNAFTRFDAAISKKFEKQLEDFSEEQYRKFEELKELFEFLDDIIPEDEDPAPDPPKKKGNAARKRRSESVVSASTDGDQSVSASSKRSSIRSKAKRRRLSTSDDESDYDSDGTERRASPPPPSRTLPKRTAAAKKTVIDDYDDDPTPEPVYRKSGAKYVSRIPTKTAEEARLDAEIDDLLNGSLTDSDDSEDEVNDLLGDI